MVKGQASDTGLSGTPNAQGGIDYSQRFQETLRARDRVETRQVHKRKVKDSVRTRDEPSRKETQVQENKFNQFSAYGEASAPPLDRTPEFYKYMFLTQEAAKEAAGLLYRPVENLGTEITNFVTGSEKETKYTPVQDLFKSIEQSGIKPDELFMEETQKKIQSNPKEVIFSGGGEVLLGAITAGAFKAGQAVGNVISETKLLKNAANIVKTFDKPPKQTIELKAPKISIEGRIPGGIGLKQSKLKVSKAGGDWVQVESNFPKQDKAVFLNVKTKEIINISGETKSKGLTQARIRGNLQGSSKLTAAQQRKFDLYQTGKGVQETGGKPVPDLIKAAESKTGIAQIGKAETISVEQAQTRGMGRYLFSTEKPTSTPSSKVGLFETKDYGTVGAEIKGGSKRPFGIGGKSERPKVFEAFKEKTVSTKDDIARTGLPTQFKTKRPTSTFVTDVQKNIRFEDPFSKASKGQGKPWLFKEHPRGTTKEGIGLNPTGKQTTIQTTTKEGRKEVAQQLKAEQRQQPEILISDPRFGATNAYITKGALISEAGGSQAKGENRNIVINKPNPQIQKPITGLNIKVTQGDKQKDKINTSVTPKNIFTMKDEVTTDLTKKQKEIFTTAEDEGFKFEDKFSYKLITGGKEDIVPDDPFVPNKPIIPDPIIPPRIPVFGLPPGPRSSRDFDSPDRPIIGLKAWKGNNPEFSLVGIYGKRSEITYSSGGIRGVKKKKTKGRKTTSIFSVSDRPRPKIF